MKKVLKMIKQQPNFIAPICYDVIIKKARVVAIGLAWHGTWVKTSHFYIVVVIPWLAHGSTSATSNIVCPARCIGVVLYNAEHSRTMMCKKNHWWKESACMVCVMQSFHACFCLHKVGRNHYDFAFFKRQYK